jgi:hypothetical protein
MSDPNNRRSVLVELKPEALESIWEMSFGKRIALSIDPVFTPILMGAPTPDVGLRVQMADVPRAKQSRSPSVLVRSDISPDEIESIAKLPGVIAVWSDPDVGPIGIDCDSDTAKGAAQDVVRALRADEVWAIANTHGGGVSIGIVDGGVDAAQFSVIGGWSPDPASPPGASSVQWGGHGNMCAFDARIACPQADFFDYAIGRTTGDVPALLSSVLQCYQHALNEMAAGRRYAHVMSNSWGLYQQSWDPYPPGHPMNYTHNVGHPAIRKIMEYIDSGNLVAFAAGNCGEVCPDGRCGMDVGPGRSIRGVNGHERVICVGAVNIRDEWIGYSSQGPSTLALQKPDVCGFSHFRGYFSSDAGTSAACPVVAGVLGLLRATGRPFDQGRALMVLQRTARQRTASAWSNDYGFGIVDAMAAYGAFG